MFRVLRYGRLDGEGSRRRLGGDMQVSCAHCGALVSIDAAACPRCGTALATVQVGAAQPRPVSEPFGRGALAVIVASAVVTLVALAAMVIWLVPHGGGAQLSIVSAAAEAPAGAGESEPEPTWAEWAEPADDWTAEPLPDPTGADGQYSVGAGSFEIVTFASPDGDIVCQMADLGDWAETVCQRLDTDAEGEADVCDGTGAEAVALPGDGSAYTFCQGVAPEPDRVLELDTPLDVGGMICMATVDWGLECWNEYTYGFTMDRAGGVEFWG